MGKRRPSGDGMVRRRKDGRWEGRIVIGHKNNDSPIFRYVSAKTQKELLKKLHQSMEEYQGVDLSEVMAFGDNDNDLPMLALAGRPYIMEQASPLLAARFSRRCPSVEAVLETFLSGLEGE